MLYSHEVVSLAQMCGCHARIYNLFLHITVYHLSFSSCDVDIASSKFYGSPLLVGITYSCGGYPREGWCSLVDHLTQASRDCSGGIDLTCSLTGLKNTNCFVHIYIDISFVICEPGRRLYLNTNVLMKNLFQLIILVNIFSGTVLSSLTSCSF